MSDTGKKNLDLTELRSARPSWWKLPFDPTTNFSLFGLFLIAFGWALPTKRTDMNLKDG